MYYVEEQNIFQNLHQKIVLWIETELFPDGKHKALLADHKSSFRNETQLLTVIQIHQHMQLAQNKSHTKATHSR